MPLVVYVTGVQNFRLTLYFSQKNALSCSFFNYEKVEDGYYVRR